MERKKKKEGGDPFLFYKRSFSASGTAWLSLCMRPSAIVMTLSLIHIFDKDGNDAYNRLSELCLEASRELKLIDPKINMRVSSKTPMRLFELGTKLTKEGLGFPQYSNDRCV